ncbi:hypothetical protein Tco_1222557, partial [Tanacetum coccineum]
MADHSRNWYDGATTRERIEGSSDNIDTKKLNENIHAFQEKADQLTQTVLTNAGERVKAKTKNGKKGNPYKTREIVCIIENPEKTHKAHEDERDMEDGWDFTVKDVERFKQILTPTVHTLPNLEPVMQPYMPLNLARDETKVIREEEQDYNIPLHDDMMQPLTLQTVHITPPNDDYVALATNPIFDMRLK